MKKLVIAAVSMAGLIETGLCQAPAPPVQSNISDHIRIESFQSRKRDDDNGIASFAIVNETEKQISSLELTCWIDNERERGTKVLVWPKEPIPARKTQQFSNVNIGLVGVSKAACEVTAAE